MPKSTEQDLCPSLNNLTANSDIVTVDSVNTLRLDSYNRTVGSVVKVSCLDTQKLHGQKIVECQKNLTWTSEPRCETPPTTPDMSTRTQLIISLSTVSGILVLITIVGIICAFLRKEEKEGDNYKHMKNDSLENSTHSLRAESNKYCDMNYAAFYGPKSYPPSNAWCAAKYICIKRTENIHMTPVSLPQNKSHWEVIEAAIPRLPSTTSLDAPTPSNFKKKKYDFEEFNVYALQQGRDPFLWRPVVSNMHFDN